MAMYKGFSTINRVKKFRITDVELAKQDLINHFNTRKGEKLMNPEFGSIIWNSIYEPLTEDLKDAIIDDVKNIVKTDPRLMVNTVNLVEYDSGLRVEISMTYVPTNQVNLLYLQFSKSENTVQVVQ